MWEAKGLRSNQTADTNRLLDGPDAVRGQRAGDGVSIGARGLLAEPLEKVGSICGLALGVGKRLAVLPSDELGNIFVVLNHEVVPLAQELGTLAASLCAECLEGIGGSLDGGVGVVGCALSAATNEFPRGRVYGCQLLYGCHWAVKMLKAYHSP